MGRFAKRRLTAEERDAKKLRRHEHLRQIKGRYVHSDKFHGPFKHPGDETLARWLELLPKPYRTVLAACNERHVRALQTVGVKNIWHVERKPTTDELLLGNMPKKPEAWGPLGRLKFSAPLAGAFICERLQRQDNVHAYLVALRNAVQIDAPVALVVPNAHHELVDDHVNLFTAGTLVYSMVRAGWNCRDATVTFDGRFINVIVRRVDVPEPWPTKVDDIGQYAPFRNVFNYCSSEFAEVYRQPKPNGGWF